MQKFLSIKNIVEIQSLAVKNAFNLGRFNTLAILKYSSNNPLNQLTYYENQQAVFSDYGVSEFNQFASIYFNYTSKALTSPLMLGAFIWNTNDTSASLKGGACNDISVLKTLKGSFSIEIDNIEKDITIDLTNSGIVSYDNVANAIQNALNAIEDTGFKNAICQYSTITNGFIISSGTQGANSQISFINSPSSGTDISQGLGLIQTQGALIIQGLKGLPTLQDALNEIQAINGNYYVITPNFTFEDEANDLITFGSFIKNSKNRYLGIYLYNNPNIGTQDGFLSNLFGYDGLYIDYQKTPLQNAFSSAIISAMDLQNTYYNIDFNDATTYKSVAVSNQSEFNNMNANRANSFYVLGEFGESITSYGRGYIMGAINNANVYINQSFLQTKMQFAIANLFKNVKFVSLKGGQGISMIKASLTPIFTNALKVGLIITSELNASEQIAVTDNFNDKEEALNQLQNNGWYLEVESINTATKSVTFNFAYISNLPTNKVIINTYILGA